MPSEADAGSVVVSFRADVRKALSSFEEYNRGLRKSTEQTKRSVKSIRAQLDSVNTSGAIGAGAAAAGNGQGIASLGASLAIARRVGGVTDGIVNNFQTLTIVADQAFEAAGTSVNGYSRALTEAGEKSRLALTVMNRSIALLPAGVSSSVQQSRVSFTKFNKDFGELASKTQTNVTKIRKSLNTLNLIVAAGVGVGVLKLGSDFDKIGRAHV